MTTTTTTELPLGANSHLFDSESARYPDDDLTVWTPRAFSTSDSMMVVEAGGLDCALSATAEQSDRARRLTGATMRTMREEETQVRWWAEDDNQKGDDDEAPDFILVRSDRALMLSHGCGPTAPRDEFVLFRVGGAMGFVDSSTGDVERWDSCAPVWRFV
jgi:hypothetical protein